MVIKLNDLLKKLSVYTHTHKKHPVTDTRLLWLLIGVDYHFIEKYGVKGILDFEASEHGCIGAMAKAFIQMLNNVYSGDLFNIRSSTTLEQQRDCAQKIETRMRHFHKLCSENVIGLNIENTPGEYRNTIASYRFSFDTDPPNGTIMGYSYLKSRPYTRGSRDMECMDNFYAIGNNRDGSVRIVSTENHENIKKIVPDLILRLIQDLQIPDLVYARYLTFISEFIQDMELLHPFYDFNNRILVNLLLNEILIDLGFHPAIFRQPKVFNGFAPAELVIEIQEGQRLLKKITKNFVITPEEIQANRKNITDNFAIMPKKIQANRKNITNNFVIMPEKIQANRNALLTLALRNDSPDLLAEVLSYTNIPPTFKNKFIMAVLGFKHNNPAIKEDLLFSTKFLEHFMDIYGTGPDGIFATTILISLLSDDTSGHLSWHLDFFIKYFFKKQVSEPAIIDAYFNSLAFVTDDAFEEVKNKTLAAMLSSESGSGHTLYKSSKNKVAVIFRYIDWYTSMVGNGQQARRDVNGLTDWIDNNAPAGTKLSYEERRKVHARIDIVFSQPRRRSFSI